MTSVFDVCRLLAETGKSSYYPMIYRLICLVLTLPVSTATTERAFSSINIIKSKLRNKMNDELLDDLMVLYVERTFSDCISDDDVISEFEMSGPRRAVGGEFEERGASSPFLYLLAGSSTVSAARLCVAGWVVVGGSGRLCSQAVWDGWSKVGRLLILLVNR
ncbi:hypothetical protein QQ045_014384 [Rhodiola kirilowii]